MLIFLLQLEIIDIKYSLLKIIRSRFHTPSNLYKEKLLNKNYNSKIVITTN